jgi:hypothetical protein
MDLSHYNRIFELDKIKYGSYIRWINNDDKEQKLKKGMFVCDIILTNEGIILKGKTYQGRFINIKMENCIIFQKMSNDEIAINHILNTIKYF